MELILPEFKKKLVAVTKGTGGHYDDSGDYVPGTPDNNIDFEGAVLPLSVRDFNQFQTTTGGMFSVDDKKLYIECGLTFLNQTIVKDGDKQYKIYIVRDYDIINPNFRLYYMKKIDKVER